VLFPIPGLSRAAPGGLGLSRALFSMTDWVDDIAQRPDLARPCMERPRRYQRRTYGRKAANTSAYGHRLKGREGISVRHRRRAEKLSAESVR
jgi:hypothetical protein